MVCERVAAANVQLPMAPTHTVRQAHDDMSCSKHESGEQSSASHDRFPARRKERELCHSRGFPSPRSRLPSPHYIPPRLPIPRGCSARTTRKQSNSSGGSKFCRLGAMESPKAQYALQYATQLILMHAETNCFSSPEADGALVPPSIAPPALRHGDESDNVHGQYAPGTIHTACLDFLQNVNVGPLRFHPPERH